MSGGPYITEELLIRWIRMMRQRRYYGKTIISWENGQISHIDENRTMKQQDLERETAKGS
ncbi:MAG: hypothetical protein HY611_03600 [Elusimicrobia bacterium]|nr:hypothetical protein [Elusimicrobiota bacterium]